MVQTPAGERYTKAGSLQINASGTLVDLNGNPVLSDLGPLRFEPTETEITIARNGAIMTNEGCQGLAPHRRVRRPACAEPLGRQSLLGRRRRPNTGTILVQGAIERSNVSGVAEIANMIRVQRAYASMAQMMQRQDEVRRTAIERLGTLNA